MIKSWTIGLSTESGIQEYHIEGIREYFPGPEKPTKIIIILLNNKQIEFDYYSVEYCFENKQL